MLGDLEKLNQPGETGTAGECGSHVSERHLEQRSHDDVPGRQRVPAPIFTCGRCHNRTLQVISPLRTRSRKVLTNCIDRGWPRLVTGRTASGALVRDETQDLPAATRNPYEGAG